MADNYLEKKMEEHKARTVAPLKAKSNVAALLDKCGRQCVAFGDYEVRADQLRRLVGAAAKVTSAFSYKLFVGGETAALRGGGDCASLPVANGYIAVCASEASFSELLLGRVVQAMLMQAAEIGLSAFVAGKVHSPSLAPFSPRLLVAVGRSAEPSLGLDADVDIDIDNLIIR